MNALRELSWSFSPEDFFCAGILIYMSLIDLIAADFNSQRFHLSSIKVQLGGYTCLILGAALMAIIGIWA